MRRLIQVAALAALLVPAALPQGVQTPTIQSLVPSETTAGRSDFLIQVNGQYFRADDPIEGITGSRVRWRRANSETTVTLPTTYVSSTVLQATVNSELVATAGDVVIQVVNVTHQKVSNTAQFHINVPPQIDTASPLLVAFADQWYFVPLESSGGTGVHTWSVTGGDFPAGLELDPTGVISGTPTTPGTYDFELTIVDTVGVVDSAKFSVTVVTDITIQTTSPLAAGTVGMLYQLQFEAVGGLEPFQWRVVEGTLPAGLTLTNTGLLTGTPTEAGTASFQVTVTDARQRSDSVVFSLTIALDIAITTESPITSGRVGEAYTFTFAAAGGTPPYTWTLDDTTVLPPGLALSAAGMLVGTPTSAGTYQFTITVFDVQGAAASADFSLTIAPRQLAIATTSPLPDGAVGTAYSVTMQAIGGMAPYVWAVIEGVLPPGLTMATDGTVSGTPTEDGTYVFQVRVTDSTDDSSAEGLFQLVIAQGALAIVTDPYLPSGATGDPYQATLEATGGTPPYSWEVIVGATPTGVNLASNGVLSGTPTAFGDFGFRARVTDAAGATAEQNFAVTIAAPSLPQVSVEGLPTVSEPSEQPTFEVNLASPYPAAIEGRATLTFTPDAVVPADDATVQFTAGGRTLDFTIAQGETGATVSDGELAIQTGSVAGVIRVSVELFSGGVDVTPSPQPFLETRVERAAPAIRSVDISSVSGGFAIVIVGISTPREVTQAVFQFTAASQADLRTTEVTVDVNSAFVEWYQNENSAAYGSAFTYTQPFTVTGDSNAVARVTVTLRNSQGDSTTVTESF